MQTALLPILRLISYAKIIVNGSPFGKNFRKHTPLAAAGTVRHKILHINLLFSARSFFVRFLIRGGFAQIVRALCHWDIAFSYFHYSRGLNIKQFLIIPCIFGISTPFLFIWAFPPQAAVGLCGVTLSLHSSAALRNTPAACPSNP